jgi:hypothetical protein
MAVMDAAFRIYDTMIIQDEQPGSLDACTEQIGDADFVQKMCNRFPFRNPGFMICIRAESSLHCDDLALSATDSH